MKKLFLIRHAKSSWSNHELKDIERPLNDRGKYDAPRMGKYLAHRAEKAEIIFSSPALRAISTARAIQENWKSPSKIEEKVKLYEGNTSEILDLINQIEDTLESVGLVFHNPMITQLVNYLTNSDIPNIPTAGLAIIQFNKECWSEIEVETGNLLDFAVPKELKIN